MLLRALAVWLLLMVLAVANGAVRNALITPQVGHVISTIILCVALLVVSWVTMGWLEPGSPRDALLIGGFWLLLTVAFEFLAGHYVFGNSWQRLLADYNLLQGRVWVLVLITTVTAPLVAAFVWQLPGFER